MIKNVRFLESAYNSKLTPEGVHQNGTLGKVLNAKNSDIMYTGLLFIIYCLFYLFNYILFIPYLTLFKYITFLIGECHHHLLAESLIKIWTYV